MYRRIRLAIPLCCWPFPQLCGFPFPSAGSGSLPVRPAASWAFLQSVPRLTLAGLHPPSGSSHGLFPPTAPVRFEGPHHSRFPHPPSFRLQGLSTLVPVYSLRILVRPVSSSPRSWGSPFGAFSSEKYRGVSASVNLLAVFPASDALGLALSTVRQAAASRS
jgi:hypothetical protein